MKRIIYFAHGAGSGGGEERVTAEHVKALLESGYKVTLVARSCDLPADDGLKLLRVRAPSRPAVLSFIVFWLLTLLDPRISTKNSLSLSSGAITPRRVDVVVAHFCVTAYYGSGKAARSSGIAVLTERLFALIAGAGERFAYRPSGRVRVAAVSEDLRRELVNWFPQLEERVGVAPNGVDVERYTPRGDTSADVARGRTAIFVGGDWERKNLAVVIEAIALTADWSLIVVGKGDTTAYALHAARAGVADRVEFVGYADPLPYLQRGDAYVSASSYEAFSLALLEAAACALPLVLTPVAGTAEFIEKGAALSVEPCPQDIAAALTAVEQDTGMMGRLARSVATLHTWSGQTQKLLDLGAQCAD